MLVNDEVKVYTCEIDEVTWLGHVQAVFPEVNLLGLLPEKNSSLFHSPIKHSKDDRIDMQYIIPKHIRLERQDYGNEFRPIKRHHYDL